MGLLETELKEIREDIKHYRAGKLSSDDVRNLIAMYSQTEKRMKLMLSIATLTAKHGKKHLNRLAKTNLIGNGTVIELSPGEIEYETVMCPIGDRQITRGECVDYSGDAGHQDDCKGCDTGIECKRVVVGPPMYTA